MTQAYAEAGISLTTSAGSTARKPCNTAFSQGASCEACQVVEAATGVAAKAGLRGGDLILSVDNVEVTGVKQFQAQMAKLEKAKVINLVVRRDEAVTFVLLRPTRS